MDKWLNNGDIWYDEEWSQRDTISVKELVDMLMISSSLVLVMVMMLVQLYVCVVMVW